MRMPLAIAGVAMISVPVVVEATSSVYAGDVVPIPTLPLDVTFPVTASELSVPTDVSELDTTLDPSVVLLRTVVPLMAKYPDDEDRSRLA
jgi:hypothetical protein